MSIRCNEEADGQLHDDPIFSKPETKVETTETVREQKSAALLASLGSTFGDLSPLKAGNTEK